MCDISAFSVKLPLAPRAILIDVELKIPTIVDRAEETVCIKTKALIDTGANGSCISKRLVSACKLRPVSAMKMISAHGLSIAQVYEISMLLPGGILFSDIPAVEVAGGRAFDVIIGMDILAGSDFAFSSNDSESCFSMRLPSAHEVIDFSK